MRASPRADQRAEAFFSPFDDTERLALEAFVRRVETAAAKADLVVVVARRAWCLLSVLRLLGRFRTNKPIISDRTLDWGPDLVRGKDVLLVDDCIVRGQALALVIQQLKHAASVHIEVLAYNKERLNTSIVTPPPECWALSSQQISELCSNIVDGFSLVPIPYATDFPLYTHLPLTQSTLFGIIHATEFHVHDLRTQAQVRHHVFNYSLLPRLPLRQLIERQIGLAPSADALLKVRILGRHLRYPRESIWAVAVPMVVLPAIAADEIDRLLAPRIEPLVRGDAEPGKIALKSLLACREPNCYKAKFRLLSAVLATEAMRVCASVLQRNHGVDLRKAKLAGVEHLIDSCASGLFSLGAPLQSEVARSSGVDLHTVLLAQLPKIARSSTGNSLFEVLMEPFLALFRANEEEASADLFTPTAATEQNQESQPTLTLQTLRAAIVNLAERGIDTASAISVFLDDAVDRGFVVPETHWSSAPPAVTRSYRYGENLLFNREDQVLLACMLREFYRANPVFAPKATEMHKILSLLLRFGFKYDLFRACTPELANREREWISRKFWLHGVVPAVTTNRGVVMTKTDKALLERLVQDRYLSRQKDDTYVIGDKDTDLNQFDVGRVDKSTLVGSLVGEVYRRYKSKQRHHPRGITRTGPGRKPTPPPRKEENELILLSTCLDANDAVAALAAEAEYLAERWGRSGADYGEPSKLSVPELMTRLGGANSVQEEASCLQALRQELRHVLNDIKQPAHSALWKFRSFVDGKCERIAIRCERALPSTRDKAFWRQLIGNYRAYKEDWRGQLLGVHMLRSAAFFAKVAFLWAQTELLVHARLNGLAPADLSKALRRGQQSPDQLWLDFDQTQFDVEESLLEGNSPGLVDKFCGWLTLFAQIYQECSEINRFEMKDRLRAFPGMLLADRLSVTALLRETEAILDDEVWEIVWIANELYRDIEDPVRVIRRQEFLVVDYSRMDLPAPDAHQRLLANYVVPYNQAYPNAKLMDLPRDRWPNPNQAVLIPIEANAETSVPQFIEYLLLSLPRWPCTLSFIALTNLPARYSAYIGSTSSRAGCRPMGNAMYEAALAAGHLPPGQILVLSAETESRTALLFSNRFGKMGLSAAHDSENLYITALTRHTQIDWAGKTHVIPTSLPPALCNRSVPKRQPYLPMTAAPTKKFAVGVITVVSTETIAVHQVLDDGDGLHELKEGRFWGGPFFFAKVQLADGTIIDVVHHQCTGEGQQPAADAFNRVVEEFHPDLMLLVGIAGGVHPKVKIGDVVFGQSVVYLEPGVYKGGVHHARIDNIPKVPECILRMLQAFERRHGEEPTVQFGDRSLQIFRGIIGASESVIKDEDAKPLVLFRLLCENARAIEMEGAGFTRAFQTQSARLSGAPRGWLVIRGICDRANRKKNDGARQVAALNAASVMKEFLVGLTVADLATASS